MPMSHNGRGGLRAIAIHTWFINARKAIETAKIFCYIKLTEGGRINEPGFEAWLHKNRYYFTRMKDGTYRISKEAKETAYACTQAAENEPQ